MGRLSEYQDHREYRDAPRLSVRSRQALRESRKRAGRRFWKVLSAAGAFVVLAAVAYYFRVHVPEVREHERMMEEKRGREMDALEMQWQHESKQWLKQMEEKYLEDCSHCSGSGKLVIGRGLGFPGGLVDCARCSGRGTVAKGHRKRDDILRRSQKVLEGFDPGE